MSSNATAAGVAAAESHDHERDPRARLAPYGCLYGPLAVVALVLSFTPLYRLGPSSTETYSLWRETTEPGGGIAGVGVCFLLVLITLLVAATFAPHAPVLGYAIAALGAVIALMVATHPGFGDEVSLNYYGVACVVVACCGAALGVAHGVHTTVLRGRRR